MMAWCTYAIDDEIGSGVRHHGNFSKKTSHSLSRCGLLFRDDGNRIEEGSDAGGIVLFRRISRDPGQKFMYVINE